MKTFLIITVLFLIFGIRERKKKKGKVTLGGITSAVVETAVCMVMIVGIMVMVKPKVYGENACNVPTEQMFDDVLSFSRDSLAPVIIESTRNCLHEKADSGDTLAQIILDGTEGVKEMSKSNNKR